MLPTSGTSPSTCDSFLFILHSFVYMHSFVYIALGPLLSTTSYYLFISLVS